MLINKSIELIDPPVPITKAMSDNLINKVLIIEWDREEEKLIRWESK